MAAAIDKPMDRMDKYFQPGPAWQQGALILVAYSSSTPSVTANESNQSSTWAIRLNERPLFLKDQPQQDKTKLTKIYFTKTACFKNLHLEKAAESQLATKQTSNLLRVWLLKSYKLTNSFSDRIRFPTVTLHSRLIKPRNPASLTPILISFWWMIKIDRACLFKRVNLTKVPLIRKKWSKCLNLKPKASSCLRSKISDLLQSKSSGDQIAYQTLQPIGFLRMLSQMDHLTI